MDGIGSNLVQEIRAKIAAGQDIRLVFDNIDFKVLVNIILKDHRNSDNHWIAHFLTFERVPSSGLDDKKPQKSDPSQFENINYLLNEEETQKVREQYIILVARVLVEFFPFLLPISTAIPAHIEHRYHEF